MNRTDRATDRRQALRVVEEDELGYQADRDEAVRVEEEPGLAEGFQEDTEEQD